MSTLSDYIESIKPQFDFNGKKLQTPRQKYYSFAEIQRDFPEQFQQAKDPLTMPPVKIVIQKRSRVNTLLTRE